MPKNLIQSRLRNFSEENKHSIVSWPINVCACAFEVVGMLFDFGYCRIRSYFHVRLAAGATIARSNEMVKWTEATGRVVNYRKVAINRQANVTDAVCARITAPEWNQAFRRLINRRHSDRRPSSDASSGPCRTHFRTRTQWLARETAGDHDISNGSSQNSRTRSLLFWHWKDALDDVSEHNFSTCRHSRQKFNKKILNIMHWIRFVPQHENQWGKKYLSKCNSMTRTIK